MKGVGEEADKSEAGDQHRGRLIGWWRKRGTAEAERGGEEEEERADAGRQDEGGTEGDVVEEVVEAGLDRAHRQLLLPGGSDRHHLFPQTSVNIVQHLNAKNLRKKTYRVGCSKKTFFLVDKKRIKVVVGELRYQILDFNLENDHLSEY